jgi:hypothetical protein
VVAVSDIPVAVESRAAATCSLALFVAQANPPTNKASAARRIDD